MFCSAINEEEDPGWELHLNRVKSLLFVPSNSLLPLDFPIEAFDLCGFPIGWTSLSNS